MDFRSTPCVFLGYSPSYHGYHCLDISTERLYIIRHIHFNEAQFPFDIPKTTSLPTLKTSPYYSSESPYVIPTTDHPRTLRQERINNSFDGDDLVFEFMIGFRKFTAYRDPFLPMNIILRKAYNTIIIEGLEGTRKNLVAIIKDVYVFVGSFTYITDFVVLEDIGEFIMSDMAEVLMGRRFRKITKLEYDVGAGMLTRAMAKQLSATSAHKCLFLDFLSEEEPKKVSEAYKASWDGVDLCKMN
ncbi:hypothetical protein Tco_0518938 [Tanacetum coccineum]